MKNIDVVGTYGERTMHLMVRFPRIECLNVDTDKRRIKYLACNLQRDLLLEEAYNVWSNDNALPTNFLEKLIWCRAKDCQHFNVLLLLLVASLEYPLPTVLMESTLQEAKLDKLSQISTIHLFLLPKDIRCRICCLLLSAVKVDRDAKKDDSLHDKLYLCLHYTVMDIAKRMHAVNDRPLYNTSKQMYCEYRSLLAAEVVQLLCIVPVFFEFIQNDPGVKHLVSVASADDDMQYKVSMLMSKVIANGGNTSQVVEEVSELLLSALYENTKNVISHKIPARHPAARYVLSKSIQRRRPMSSPVYTSHLLAEGGRAQSAKSTQVIGLSPRKVAPRKPPALGEKVLLGPQNIGFIIALPEADIALIQTENRQTNGGSTLYKLENNDDFYSYVDMTIMFFDKKIGCWKPRGTVGDRVTMKGAGDEIMPSNPPSSPESARTPKGSHVCLVVNTETQQNTTSDNLTSSSCTSEIYSMYEPEESSKQDNQQVALNEEADYANSALYDCVTNAVATFNKPNAEKDDVFEDTKSLQNIGCRQCMLSKCFDCKPDVTVSECRTPDNSEKMFSGANAHLTVDLQLDGEHTKTQVERIEMWNRSVQNYKPKKRANSAFARCSSMSKSASPVMIQMGNSWLAGGRDLHYITKMTNRMKLSSHTPGWKQGLQNRPSSSKSLVYRPQRVQNKVRNVRSACPRLEQVSRPSPASSVKDGEESLHYMYHQFNTQRAITPPSYQGQACPPSPLNMTIK
ncbi:uncharacterized protein [Antedon mediterranea]|uniref:uncharacterized protein n=1 Tax=Antedon mediterranea TaxID=105859 RepID=UPI003AF6E46D